MQDSLDFRNPFLDNMFLQDGQYEFTTDGLKVTGQNTVTTKPFRFDSDAADGEGEVVSLI